MLRVLYLDAKSAFKVQCNKIYDTWSEWQTDFDEYCTEEYGHSFDKNHIAKDFPEGMVGRDHSINVMIGQLIGFKGMTNHKALFGISYGISSKDSDIIEKLEPYLQGDLSRLLDKSLKLERI